MENPDLVEEYPQTYEMTQFEKILVATKRAKDLHNSQKTPLIDTERKAPYAALEEIKERKIRAVYREEEGVELLGDESDDGDDDE